MFWRMFVMNKQHVYEMTMKELREYEYKKKCQQERERKSVALKMTLKDFLNKMKEIQITVKSHQFDFWDMYSIFKKFVDDFEVLAYFVERITSDKDREEEFDIDSNEVTLRHRFEDIFCLAGQLKKEINAIEEKYGLFRSVIEECIEPTKKMLEESGEGAKND